MKKDLRRKNNIEIQEKRICNIYVKSFKRERERERDDPRTSTVQTRVSVHSLYRRYLREVLI